jgi:hypothetical protein
MNSILIQTSSAGSKPAIVKLQVSSQEAELWKRSAERIGQSRSAYLTSLLRSNGASTFVIPQKF